MASNIFERDTAINTSLTTSQQKNMVLVGGCFDVLHFGHIEFLRKAKTLGNYLVVALESDENVTKRKGKLRPIHTQNQRKAMLEALSFVDNVLLLPTMTCDSDYETLVMKLKPNIIAITSGDPYQKHKKKQAKKINARVAVIKKIHTPSTSQLAKLIGLE